jgi:hypothetical protein
MPTPKTTNKLSSRPLSNIAWPCIAAVILILSVGVMRSAGRRLARNAARENNSSVRHPRVSLPHVILWAWERPEKLDFIDTERAGVAFLAKTIYLREDKVVTQPRLQTLSVRPETVLIAVARIETDRIQLPSLSHDQVETVAKEIVGLALLPNVTAVQIDFDAKVSERSFYADLLAAVRKTLPSKTVLSITALASWCKGDNWLDNLPVDEAVPMLFRMGVDRAQIVSGLASGETFHSPLCRQSSGVSVDETLPDLPPSERIYVFNPNSWSPNSVERIMEKYQR